MRRTIGIMAALLALTVSAGCSGGEQDPDDPNYRGPAVTTTQATAAPTTTPPPATATTAAPVSPPAKGTDCAVTKGWNTSADEEAPYSTEKLFRVRAGNHGCFDRVVFDIKGTAPAGFVVQYVPVVQADGSGDPVPVAGGAALQVIVRSYIQGYPEGEMLAGVGDRFYTTQQLSGFQALREVRFAGFFEGQSTTAVGVRVKLPFRAYTVMDNAAQVRKVVVDIAHQ